MTVVGGGEGWMTVVERGELEDDSSGGRGWMTVVERGKVGDDSSAGGGGGEGGCVWMDDCGREGGA